MKPILFLIAIAGVLLSAGCSSTPAKVDTKNIRAKTFSFIQAGDEPTPAFAEKREQVHALIQEGITKNLAARGLSRVDKASDVTVAYLVIVGNNASTEAISRYFGYGRDTSALLRKAHEAYTDSKNPNYFEAGTLVVDIVDTATFKLLWRRHITRPLLQDIPEAERSKLIQQYIDDVLGELRIAPQ